MSADRIPYAPLTLGEMNHRVADVASRIAWHVAACFRDGGDMRERDVELLREYAAQLETWQAAAVVRCAS